MRLKYFETGEAQGAGENIGVFAHDLRVFVGDDGVCRGRGGYFVKCRGDAELERRRRAITHQRVTRFDWREQARRSNGPADAKSRQIEELGRAPDGYRALAHIANRRQTHVFAFTKHRTLVYFIGKHCQVKFLRHARDAFEFVARGDVTARIMRRTVHEQLRSRRHRRAQLIDVNREIRRLGANGDRLPAQIFRYGVVPRKIRRDEQNLILWRRNRRLERAVQRLRGATRHHHHLTILSTT